MLQHIVASFCYYTCVSIQAADANTAQVAKVVPTPNNGYTELVKLHKQKVGVFSLRPHKKIKLVIVPHPTHINGPTPSKKFLQVKFF